MLKIFKIDASPVIDFAAEELKKYLRMMMPMDGEISIEYKPDAKEGFRLGLMQTFGLDVSDAEVPELDDILYIDTDAEGGIIAGDNARSVLLSVYEYLRQNGCRFLFPGVDGELIPVKKNEPVKYRHKPSMRYRGQVNESATSQRAMLETIDFGPKVGQNCYMATAPSIPPGSWLSSSPHRYLRSIPSTWSRVLRCVPTSTSVATTFPCPTLCHGTPSMWRSPTSTVPISSANSCWLDAQAQHVLARSFDYLRKFVSFSF